MKVHELVKRLLDYDQDCDVEFIVCDQKAMIESGGVLGASKCSIGSIYDDTDPLYNRPEDLKEKPSLVTVELDYSKETRR